MSARIAVLGGGVMGETLLSAIIAAGHADVVVAEKFPDRADELRERYDVEVLDPADAVVDAGIVLVVVKPQDVGTLLEEISGSLAPAAVVVSLAAGVRTATIEARVAEGVAVVRAMPNTPALVGEGMFGVSAGSSCDAHQLQSVVDLLATSGEVVVVDEEQQDALTAVSGSGPAYVFYLAEAMIAGGVESGLDEQVARTLAAQTLVGAAKLLNTSHDPPAELRRRVTSPHGTTAAAIDTFDERGVRDGLVAGVRAAARRSAELSGS
ncbi:pyrroline-5-carboxylate reductase [Aeromicrobium sp. CTD01-1L150]|uniref:pyrroline-5-carboxylate reductase n=1 Tax=Aeromicrobium sp. CTD01-1L150 TaxID=3341830 RepID=UPI0035C2102D